MLGLLGGVGRITEAALRNDYLWNRFEAVVEREYSMVFGTGPLPGTHLDSARPNTLVPAQLLGNFTACT